MELPSEVYLGLGSNLGDRAANLNAALAKLKNHPQIKLKLVSKLYENPAIEEAGPEKFLNGVVLINTDLSPQELLQVIQEIETEVDPKRNSRGRKKARYLDIDILIFDNLQIQEDDLIIPHPRMYEREFVTKPLQEVQIQNYKFERIPKANEAIEFLQILPDFYAKPSSRAQELSNQIVNLLNTQSKVKLRRLAVEDLDTVLEIDEEAFGEKHWTKDIYLKELKNPYALYHVLTDSSNKILAFAGMWIVVDEMHIMTLATDQKHRGKKYAELLLLSFFDTCLRSHIRSVTLEVRVSNQAAINLYTKYAFVSQGVRRKYYKDGENARVLWTKNIQEEEFLKTLEANILVLQDFLLD